MEITVLRLDDGGLVAAMNWYANNSTGRIGITVFVCEGEGNMCS